MGKSPYTRATNEMLADLKKSADNFKTVIENRMIQEKTTPRISLPIFELTYMSLIVEIQQFCTSILLTEHHRQKIALATANIISILDTIPLAPNTSVSFTTAIANLFTHLKIALIPLQTDADAKYNRSLLVQSVEPEKPTPFKSKSPYTKMSQKVLADLEKVLTDFCDAKKHISSDEEYFKSTSSIVRYIVEVCVRLDISINEIARPCASLQRVRSDLDYKLNCQMLIDTIRLEVANKQASSDRVYMSDLSTTFFASKYKMKAQLAAPAMQANKPS